MNITLDVVHMNNWKDRPGVDQIKSHCNNLSINCLPFSPFWKGLGTTKDKY